MRRNFGQIRHGPFLSIFHSFLAAASDVATNLSSTVVLLEATLSAGKRDSIDQPMLNRQSGRFRSVRGPQFGNDLADMVSYREGTAV